MTRKKLNELIALGEGLHLEFKVSISHFGREICAFANSSGGHILVGVDDAGKTVGICDHNRVKSEIQDMARTMDPAFGVSVESVGDVLVVTVPEGRDKPYSANGKFYLREAASTQQMRRNEIREYFFKEGLIRWDEQPCRGFNNNRDFSVKRYMTFTRAAHISAELNSTDVLKNMQVISQGKMTNAGALLFSKKPARFFLCSTINCVIFQGTEKTKILDQQIFSGDILESFEKAIGYLKANLNAEYIIKGGPREELLELPEPALREALINAIAHRDYRSTGSIQVEIYRDRVQIVNPGGLVSGLSAKDLGRVSLPRNPLLFALLHRIELVENVGSGIKRIRDLMNEYGLGKPLIETGEIWFSITFARKKTQQSLEELRKRKFKDDDTRERTTQETTRETTKQTTQEKILSLMRENPSITGRELAVNLGLTEDGIKYHLKKLKQSRIIKHIGSTKSGRWKVLSK